MSTAAGPSLAISPSRRTVATQYAKSNPPLIIPARMASTSFGIGIW
jgi:hypothetical protein